jgi:hypothetical protein
MEEYHNAGEQKPPSSLGVHKLSKKHHRELEEGSAIDARIILERGYSSVSASEALALGFSKEQARDGLLIPFFTPAGEVSSQLKPHEPRVIKGKAIKYETRAGHDIVLDVHPRNYWRLLHGDEPIYVVEGIKKADCAATLGRLVVGLSGVWNWGKKRKRGGAKYGRPELLPDWDAIPLEGRKVLICFDADYREKQNVALAMLRLAERLTERGAHVYIISLPGPEKGLDDYVVAGGNLDALEADARPFTASDLTPYAAKPDKRIRETVEAILAAMRVDTWPKRSDTTAHSVMRAHLQLALERGRMRRDGRVEMVASSRELQQRSGVGCRKTVGRADANLEERGYIRKVVGSRTTATANRYILNCPFHHHLIEGERGKDTKVPIPGGITGNFTPHLRWPSPASSWVDGDDRDSKLPEDGASPENFPHEKPSIPSIHTDDAPDLAEYPEPEAALGKAVEMALHLLVSWGGSGTLRDLATATGVGRTNKMRAKLEGVAGVFGMDAKGKHGARVWLEDGWERRLDERREKGGELRRARMQAVRHRKDRDGFRADIEVDKEPPLMGAERVEEVVEERLREERERHAEEVAREQREAEQFVGEHTRGGGPVRFGLLVEVWAEEHRETEQRATWTLRKAISRLGYSLKAHAERPGEMFVYASSDKQPEPKMPPKVDGIYQHGPLCDCDWCDGPPVRRYAKIGGSA